MILLPQPLVCWGDKRAPPHPGQVYYFKWQKQQQRWEGDGHEGRARVTEASFSQQQAKGLEMEETAV